MFRPLLKIGNRTLVFLFEALAVVALLLSLAFAGFVWRLSTGPLSLGFAKDYVEGALSSKEEELSVRFDDIVLSWPELKGPFFLDLTGLKVQKGSRESNTLNVDEASVGLSRTALMFGLIRPVKVIIKSPSLALVRSRDGHLNLFLQDEAAAPVAPEKEDNPEGGAEVAALFKDMALHRKGSFISRLNEFEVRDASVAIRDYQLGLSWYLTDLDFSMEDHRQGVSAALSVALPGGGEKGASIAAGLVYRKDTDDFGTIANLTNVNPAIISRFLSLPDVFSDQDLYFTGSLNAVMDRNLIPTSMKFSGSIPEGQIVLPEQFDAPIALKNITISSEYDLPGKILNISNVSGELGGISFTGHGEGQYSDQTLSLPIRMNVKSAALAQIPPLFPKSEHDGEAYEWLAHSMKGGTFSDVALNMLLTAEKTRNQEVQRDEWVFDVPKLTLDFAFEGTDVTYSPTLMPAENAKGTGTLDLAAQTLEIRGERAKIGDVEGRNISVKVTDLMKAGAGYAYIKAKVKGPLATALRYIATDPINMGEQEIGLDPKRVKGTIEADVDVSLPTVKDVPKEQVEVKIDGTLTDLDIPEVVEGLTLSGGPLNLKTEPGGFKIKGKAQLAGRDTALDWHQYFESKGHPYSMQVIASVGADKALRNHFGVDLDEYISGTMPVDVVYTQKGDGAADIDVKGDLNPIRIYIDPFKYEKPVGTPGTISLKGSLKDDVLKELSDIDLKVKDLSVSGARLGFASINGKKADLASGTLPDAVIGKTKMSVTFDVNKNNVMKINAKGPVFDLEPFLREEPPPEEETVEAKAESVKQQEKIISLSADTMLAQNGQSVKSPKIYMETDSDGDITRLEMDGGVGKGNLAVRFKPDGTGKRTFRLESNDAGAVLYTFGVYENAHGGSLLIYGEPKGGDLNGDLYGAMRMEDFRVVKAPALASLLSLMSLTGVSQLLSNQGLVFSKLESGYEWRFRPEGNLLIIKDGTTSGSSIGLTFEGVMDRGKKTTDISGTIIPMTEVNSILSAIPLVGDILGGKTGLIAATYTMKGPSSKPEVMVNPLSVLAPGFLRRILFEGGYESKIPGDEKKPAYKEVEPKKPM